MRPAINLQARFDDGRVYANLLIHFERLLAQRGALHVQLGLLGQNSMHAQL